MSLTVGNLREFLNKDGDCLFCEAKNIEDCLNWVILYLFAKYPSDTLLEDLNVEQVIFDEHTHALNILEEGISVRVWRKILRLFGKNR